MVQELRGLYVPTEEQSEILTPASDAWQPPVTPAPESPTFSDFKDTNMHSKKVKLWARHFQRLHSEGRSRQIAVGSRQAWKTQCYPVSRG